MVDRKIILLLLVYTTTTVCSEEHKGKMAGIELKNECARQLLELTVSYNLSHTTLKPYWAQQIESLMQKCPGSPPEQAEWTSHMDRGLRMQSIYRCICEGDSSDKCKLAWHQEKASADLGYSCKKFLEEVHHHASELPKE